MSLQNRLLSYLYPSLELNRSDLKFLIVFSMTIDHVAFLISNPFLALACRFFGKITIALVTLFIADGFRYTRNRKKYLFRLLLFAVISQPFFYLYFQGSIFMLNVMYTLALAVLFLMVLENKDLAKWLKVILLGILFVLSTIGDWKYYALIMVYLHYKKRFKFSYVLILIILAILDFSWLGGGWDVYYLTFFGLLLSLPVIKLYNSSKGGGVVHKMFFYWYYPAHLLVLFLIRLCFFT